MAKPKGPGIGSAVQGKELAPATTSVLSSLGAPSVNSKKEGSWFAVLSTLEEEFQEDTQIGVEEEQETSILA